MTKPNLSITVRCPHCAVVIAGVTAETMVYCIACRKWCREVEVVNSAAPNVPATPRLRRRVRCH
jgi:hypothetical protein